MTPLVNKALENLTTKCNTSVGAFHTMDEAWIKQTLRALHKHGEVLDSKEIHTWLINNKWDAKAAKNFIKIAQTIADGGRVQIRNKSLVAGILETDKQIIKRLQAGI